jgi:hypothetical protein
MKKILESFLVWLLSMSVIQAKIINVPANQSTIQAGINATINGDTVLVDPGVYVENINFNGKNIVVGSLFLTTGDTSYISKTVMNGDSSGSVITISSGDSTTVISGFTITNGKGDEGGGINVYNASPTFSNIRIIGNRSSNGGGLNAESSNFKLVNSVIANNMSSYMGGGVHAGNSYPVFENVIVKENFATASGGGFYFASSTPKFKNVTIAENVALYNGGGISLTFSWAVFDSVNLCNIYLNHAGRGNDIDYFDFDEGNSGIILFADTFTVKNPTDYHLYRIDKFNILHGKIDQSNMDLYVNPSGNDANSGESSSQPLRTISHALSKIEAGSVNHHTIYITNGIYSPSSKGEHFPLKMVDYVSLKGEISDSVILDADGKSGVLSFDSDTGINVENITITNGWRYEGGGIYCANSNPSFTKVAITGNKAMTNGAGMVCSEHSNPILENCTISNNTAEAGSGGGIAFYESCASLLNTILWGNSPDEIYFFGLGYSRSCIAVSYTDVRDSTKKIITNNNGDVYWREGNLNSNPLFCNSDSGHYSLAENSPCVGTGENGKNIGALSVGCGTMDVKNKQVGLPIKFELYQNYPNPFNPSTTIEYEIPHSGYVEVNIFDIRGRLIRSLDKSQQQVGIHRIVWDGRDNGGTIVASGTYFCRIHFNGNLLTKKLALIK